MANATTLEAVTSIIVEILSLSDQDLDLNSDTLLLGNIPEFDSMSIVSVISAIESQFNIQIPDDELAAEAFESIGTLGDFVELFLDNR